MCEAVLVCVSLCIACVCAGAGEAKLYKSESNAESWVRSAPGDPKAGLIEDKIASVPQAIWLIGGSLDAFAKDAEKARADGETIAFVLYNIPGRDEGKYSAGGVNAPVEYEAWIEKVAAALKDAKAIAVIEPDAIGLGQNLKDKAKLRERYAMLVGAVMVLKKDPNCKAYIEISHWLSPEVAAAGLKASGIDGADGFCLNASAFERTEACMAFGTGVSRLVGDKHFIIDTSRNGNGPWQTSEKDPWCNPPGRALGHLPTFETGNPLADAFLWIKRPGESDGSCRGGPYAGGFWPEYAYELAKNAK